MHDFSTKNSLAQLLEYALPSIAGLFLTSFIIIVDGVFIGRKLGADGLAAVNMTLPLLYTLLAVTTTIAVGGLTLASQAAGRAKSETASRYFSSSLALIVLIVTSLLLALFMFQEKILLLLGATGIIYAYLQDFLGVLVYFYLFMMLNIAFSMFIRGEGKPQLSLFFALVGNLLNIALDYLFIFQLDWGLRGAALASGLSVLLPFLCGLLYFLRGCSSYTFTAVFMTSAPYRQIILNGSAECIGQISIALTTALFNAAALHLLGSNGVAAFTIVGYMLFFHSMLITGIGIGIHPIFSYHFGAGRTAPICELFVVASKAVIVASILLAALVSAAAENIVSLFAGDNTELLIIGALALRFSAPALLFSGCNFIMAVLFTATGQPAQAALTACLRGLLFVIPLLFLLPNLIGASGIWLSLPLAEFFTLAVILPHLRTHWKNLRQRPEPEQEPCQL